MTCGLPLRPSLTPPPAGVFSVGASHPLAGRTLRSSTRSRREREQPHGALGATPASTSHVLCVQPGN